MSSMYLYCAFQSRVEFSALDTSCIAMSFLRGSVRSTAAAADTDDTDDTGTSDGVAACPAPAQAVRTGTTAAAAARRRRARRPGRGSDEMGTCLSIEGGGG